MKWFILSVKFLTFVIRLANAKLKIWQADYVRRQKNSKHTNK